MSSIDTQSTIRNILDRLERLEKPDIGGANGSWTPAFTGSGTAGTFTYDTNSTGGSYTVENGRVTIDGRLRITAISVAPTGDLRITGLPYTGIAAGNGVAGYGTFTLFTGLTITAGKTQLMLRILASTAYFEIIESGSAVASAKIQGSALALIGGVADFMFSGEFRI